jgi:hypothetical protein
LRVTQADGIEIRSSLIVRNNKTAGTVGKFELSETRLGGADAEQRMTMFTPNPYQERFVGIALQHLCQAQPVDGAIHQQRLTQSVTLPLDLTFELLKDIGW